MLFLDMAVIHELAAKITYRIGPELARASVRPNLLYFLMVSRILCSLYLS